MDIVEDIDSSSERANKPHKLGIKNHDCALPKPQISWVSISHESWKCGAFETNYVTIQGPSRTL